MIHIVTSETAHQYKDQLEEMFRWRHRIYVEQRGWKEIARPDGREIDQFDTSSTVYLIAVDEAGALTGSVRLIPTHKPNFLTEIYPHLITRGEVPHSPTIWELTRIFTVPGKRGESGHNPVLSELLVSIMEFAVREEIEHYVTFAEILWLPRLLKVGYVVNPLGLPILLEGEYWLAMQFEVGEHILDVTKNFFGLLDESVFAPQFSIRKAS